MDSSAKFARLVASVKALILLALIGFATSCDDARPDPRTVEGVLIWATQRIEERDGRRLFQVIDERTRHAMISVVADRRRSAELIRESYPDELRASALANLGDAANATDATELFVQRCGAQCLDEIGATIGSPVRVEEVNGETVVHTARDTTVRLYRTTPTGWFGIAWKYDEYDAERTLANRDRSLVESNAAVYRRRQELEQIP